MRVIVEKLSRIDSGLKIDHLSLLVSREAGVVALGVNQRRIEGLMRQ